MTFTFKDVFIVVMALGIIILALLYSDKREYEVMKSAKLYEECVAKEFGGRTVLEVYYATGEYPECEW